MIENITFNLYSINFSPKKEHETKTSKDILKNVLEYVTPVNLGNKVHIIDRHKNRKGSNPRELFIDYVTYNYVEKRYKCRIVLIRSGRPPMLKPYDTFELISLDEVDKLGSLAEVTHFYIDLSKTKPYIFVEFNSNGPRALDIEFYLRNVAHEVLSIAKVTALETYLDVSLDKVLDNIKEVLNFEIKIEPQNLDSIESRLKNHYFSGLRSFGTLLKTRFLNIKASFEVSEKGGVIYDNAEANNMITKLIRSIKNKNTELDAFKNFAIEYTDNEGVNQFINIIKNQKGFEVDINLNKVKTNKDWYEAVKKDIDETLGSL